jgi:hypothetical protein
MEVNIFDVKCNYYKEKYFDQFISIQSLEWHGKVYMLGSDHIHVMTKDCKKYECIKKRG